MQATSYAARETGRYRLALTMSADVPVERRSQGRVYGLFAGISDYEAPNTDLVVETRRFRYVRVSSDERSIELLPDHRIGGAGGDEFYGRG